MVPSIISFGLYIYILYCDYIININKRVIIQLNGELRLGNDYRVEGDLICIDDDVVQ